VIEVRPLREEELDAVDAVLPLHRLDQWRADGSTFLIAWHDERPVGHALLTWDGTKLGAPEVQDVFVAEDARRRGIASELTHAAEREARSRGCDRLSLSVGLGNAAARALYERLGFEDAGIAPERIAGTIVIRGEPLEVDDKIVYLVKRL
jgi:ribosomal protein S18 acetylase RimI-like enzyme